MHLLSDDNSGQQRQGLRLLFALLWGNLHKGMRREIWWLMLFSLRVQICLLSSVEFLGFVCRSGSVWFRYLVLNAFVVVVFGLFGVVRAAAADFDCVEVDDFSKFVVFWEVLVYWGGEAVSDIVAYIFAVWGVVPENVVPQHQ